MVAGLTVLLGWQVHAANPESAFASAWRIEVTAPSTSDGTLNFKLKPRKQAVIALSVPIKAGRPPDGVARDIRGQLSRKLDRTAFGVTVERSSVVIAAEMGTPRFELEVDTAAASTFGITLKRE